MKKLNFINIKVYFLSIFQVLKGYISNRSNNTFDFNTEHRNLRLQYKTLYKKIKYVNTVLLSVNEKIEPINKRIKELEEDFRNTEKLLKEETKKTSESYKS